MLRTGRKGLAVATLLLDALKGVVGVLLMRWVAPDQDLVAGTAAVLGHTMPVWLGFRGGKGGATALGVCLAAMWPVALACAAIWLATAKIVRISSVATLVPIAASPLLALVFSDGEHALMALLVGVLVFWRHEANIRRLIAGRSRGSGRRVTQDRGAPPPDPPPKAERPLETVTWAAPCAPLGTRHRRKGTQSRRDIQSCVSRYRRFAPRPSACDGAPSQAGSGVARPPRRGCGGGAPVHRDDPRLLRLARTEGVGPLTFRRLLDRHGDPDAALAALPALATRRNTRFAVPPEPEIRAEAKALAKLGGPLRLPRRRPLPPLLALLPDAPPVLAVLGDAALLAAPAVAIVGRAQRLRRRPPHRGRPGRGAGGQGSHRRLRPRARDRHRSA